MKEYSHLGPTQRYQIEALLKANKTQSEIADILGCHPSTISREIRRNSSRVYRAEVAQKKTERRHRLKPKIIRFTEEMRTQVVDWLSVEKLSPELISVMGRQLNRDFVSDETIYKWIWASKYDVSRSNKPYRKLYKLLKHGRRRRYRGSKRDSRGIIPNRISIEQRPKIVEQRKRLGDLEGDLVLGLNHQPGLLVLTDRASLKTELIKIDTRDSNVIAKKAIQRLKKSPWAKTLTIDNDISFWHHERIKAAGIMTYFTHPFSSQEKGTVENRIGQIRRFFPKRTDFSQVTEQRVKEVENMLNNRPVRKFGYQTPSQVFERMNRIG